MNLNRRYLLAATIGAAATATLGGAAAQAATASASTTVLPRPAESGIDHIVVVMMENRSFDHFLGWLPGATGVRQGSTTSTGTATGTARNDWTPSPAAATPTPTTPMRAGE